MNLVLGLLIAHFLYQLVFKPKRGALYCGLFGGCFNQPIDELMMEKLKILGLFNQTRGKDSCGYFNGDVLIKGTDKEKEFFDLVVSKGIQYNNNGNNVFIGHTRQATYGLHTEDNAHPFNVNGKLILAHNGTIGNIWDLCRKHGIDATKIDVDSLALGHLLLRVNYPILEEYEGAAALILHRVKKPNSLYVYHGWSKEYKYSVDAKEERPLYWMESPVGVFLSSLKPALEYIRAEGYGEPQIVPHNYIYEIKNGAIVKKPIAKIDRSAIFKEVVSQFPVQHYVPQQNQFCNVGKQYSMFKNVLTGVDILRETRPKLSKVAGRIYYQNGRYRMPNDELCEGILDINARNAQIVPTDELVVKTYLKIKQCYFHKGVMLKDSASYNTIRTALDEKKSLLYHGITGMWYNFAREISHYSRYPVTCITDEESASNELKPAKRAWYQSGLPVGKFAITPLFSDRNYHFKDGILIKIIGNADEKVLITPDTSERKSEKTHYSTVDNMLKGVLTFSPEVIEMAKRFDETYEDVEKMIAGLGDYCMEALSMYAEDVLVDILMLPKDDTHIQTLSYELMQESVDTKTALKHLLDASLQGIEYYINDAMGGIKDKTDGEEREDEDVEDVSYEDVDNTKSGGLFLTDQQKLEIEDRTGIEKKNSIF